MKKKIKFVDLFAGIGGIRLGLEDVLKKQSVEFECVFSCEIHPKAQETYAANFNETPYSDIRLLDKLPTHDVLLAGFPCQAFSYAGKRHGFGDTRGTLFFEIERLLKAAKTKPKYLLLENVRGFTTHDKGRTFATVIERLDLLGYKVHPLLLNSSEFNVPQNRVRIYLVCKLKEYAKVTILSNSGASDSHKFKNNNLQRDFFDQDRKSSILVRDIVESEVDDKYMCSKTFTKQLKRALDGKAFENLNGVRLIDYRGGNSINSWDLGLKGVCTQDERKFMKALISNRRKKHFGAEKDGKRLSLDQIRTFWDKPSLENTIKNLIEKGYLREVGGTYNPVAGNMSFEVFKFLDPDSISITVVSSDCNRLGIVSNGSPRRITPREVARLQGFPDTFSLHPNDKWAYHQLGNSVSVPVISAIFEDIVNHNSDFIDPSIC